MKVAATFEQVEDVQVIVTIAMTLREWRTFREQMRNLATPAWSLGHQIANVIARLEARAEITGESEL